MEKHQLVRSISVLLILSAVFTLSNLNTELINLKRLEISSTNQLKHNSDRNSELELREIQVNGDFIVNLEMVDELEVLDIISISEENMEYMIICSTGNHTACSNNYSFTAGAFD